MTRGIWVWDADQQKIVPKDEYYARKYAKRESTQVMRDLQPYRATTTGKMIDGRAAHREHLKKHGLQELGNEYKAASERVKTPMPPVEHTIQRAFQAVEQGYKPRTMTRQEFDS